MKRAAVLLGALLSAHGAFGQDAGPGSTNAAGSLEGIVVTGNRDPQLSPTTPYVEDVIGSDTIANFSPGPSATVQSLLTIEPSIFEYSNGPLGVETSIYFRAFNSGQFSETYDGISLNDVFNAGITGQAENRNNVLITTNNLGAVHVFRGINDPSVNSYNSLGGTIDFLPRQPGDSFQGVIEGGYGNYHSYHWQGTVDTGDWNGLKQVISFAQDGSQGWINSTPDYNNNLYWGATYSPGGGIRLNNYLLYNNNRGQAVFNTPLALLDRYGDSYQWPRDWTNSYIHDTNLLEIFDAKWQASETMSFENKVFFGRNEYLRTSWSNPLDQQSATQPYTLEDTPDTFNFWQFYPNGPTYNPQTVFGSVANGTDFHFYGYTADGVGDSPALHWVLPGNDVVLGGNITHSRLHSREFWYGTEPVPQADGYNDAWDEHDTRTLFSLFAQDTIGLADDRLHITPGLKYVLAHTSDNDSVGIYYPLAGTVSDSEHFLSPTLGLNFTLTEHLHLFAAYGKNVKLPDISAYYGAFQTNNVTGNAVIVPPKVKPEHVDDFEIGARYISGGLVVEANAYRENFRDTFVTATDPTTLLSVFQNGGAAVYQGFELQIKEDFGSRLLPGQTTAYLSAAHNQAYFTSAFTSDFAGSVASGQPLADVPVNLVSAGGVWKFEDWRANADSQFIGRQYIDQAFAGTPTATTIGGHAVLNIGLSKTWQARGSGFGRMVRAAVNVDNVFDRRYLNTAVTQPDYFNNNYVTGIVGAPRIVMGSVAIGF